MIHFPPAIKEHVALRKESVDRNLLLVIPYLILRVALRKESVDRNTQRRDFKALGLPSLSARRAWIEILAVWAIEHGYQRRSPQGERG